MLFVILCVAGLLVLALIIAWILHVSSRRLVSRKTEKQKLGIRIVCISDTHGRHGSLPHPLPKGDILVHAGDFTYFGKQDDAVLFNTWLGEQKKCFQHIIVVEGNHESNAEWKGQVRTLLSNAIFLRGETLHVTVFTGAKNQDVTIHGTQFFWPMTTPNPNYNLIPVSCDVVISHGPCKGFVDGAGGGMGCSTLLGHVRRVRPRLVIGGHIHEGHGMVVDKDGVCFVNAANCRKGYTIGWDPVVVEI